MPIFCFLFTQIPPHHATPSLVQFSTFKCDEISVLKIFMGGPLQHSHMMTFLFLKVDNDPMQIFHWFS